MRPLFSLCILMSWLSIFGATALSAQQQPFITVWKTDNVNALSSNSTSIIIPTTGTGYNYEVDWDNDGVYDQSGITGNVTHNFGVAGTYTIRIRGDFPRIYFNEVGDEDKLLNILQWGDIAWTSMSRAFYGCHNLNVSATDVPDLSNVTDMSLMFAYCSKLNGPANIGTWNTATVTNMSSLFQGATIFNQPLNTWNTAAVTTMSGMFRASGFNQPIGAWNTSSVTSMNVMFYQATAFNQPIGNWNTANVAIMGSMFRECPFNQPIGTWNTASVTDMSSMFYGNAVFNQQIGDWNTASVTGMASMFYGASSFNQPIGAWNTAAVTNMREMFQNAVVFNQPIGNWNTSAVTDMSSMFKGANVFNQPIGNWNTASVTTMTSMFAGADVFNQPIGTWNTAAVTRTDNMFYQASSFNQPLANWNTAAMTIMSSMFHASAFNQPIGNWETGSVTHMENMFNGNIVFNQDIGGWNTAAVTNMSQMFNGARAFNKDISGWNTAAVTDMKFMFYNAVVFNQPIGSWNTAAVRYMNLMFREATLFNQPLDNWNVAAVGDMSNMFQNASAFNQSLGKWTLNATVQMGNMLSGAGMDCDHYTATLVGWRNNPLTPNGRSLGATGRQYGTSGTAARTYLDVTKTWTFTGDTPAAGPCSAALPVEWLAFTGEKQGSAVLLRWETAKEENNLGFGVERSTDGVNWEKIGFVQAQSDDAHIQRYSFKDTEASHACSGNCLLYYRLRQTDLDGKEELSKIVVLKMTEEPTIQIFPNPLRNGMLTLILPETIREAANVSLLNSTGQVLRSTRLEAGTHSWDLGDLAPGVYTVSAWSTGVRFIEKLIVQD